MTNNCLRLPIRPDKEKRDPKLSDDYRVQGGNDLYSVEALMANNEWEVIYPYLSRKEAVRWIVQLAPGEAKISFPGGLWEDVVNEPDA